jgi:hypothetical protein
MDETNANANAPNVRRFPLRNAMTVREMSTSIVPDVLFQGRLRSPDSMHFFGLEPEGIVSLSATEYLLLLSGGPR